MLFGLTNAPATCQQLVNDTLTEYLDVFTVAYLDDILIYSKTFEEHVRHIKIILEKLAPRKLIVKGEKCDFYKYKVDFLGFMVEREGIKIDPTKIEKILD